MDGLAGGWTLKFPSTVGLSGPRLAVEHEAAVVGFWAWLPDQAGKKLDRFFPSGAGLGDRLRGRKVYGRLA